MCVRVCWFESWRAIQLFIYADTILITFNRGDRSIHRYGLTVYEMESQPYKKSQKKQTNHISSYNNNNSSNEIYNLAKMYSLRFLTNNWTYMQNSLRMAVLFKKKK